jgi:preprotein translocase subunit SecA
VRLPEAKIKEAILQPDIELRDRAVRYFARSSTPDPTIMPLVIEAVETKNKPSLPPASRSDLPHEPASKQKVGRNDPCPCGSGKKFKNYCIKKHVGL